MSNAEALLRHADKRCREIKCELAALGDEIKPLLIGRIVKCGEYRYRIMQVSASPFWRINGYGVRISPQGKDGTRGYHINIDPTKLEPENET